MTHPRGGQKLGRVLADMAEDSNYPDNCERRAAGRRMEAEWGNYVTQVLPHREKGPRWGSKAWKEQKRMECAFYAGVLAAFQDMQHSTQRTLDLMSEELTNFYSRIPDEIKAGKRPHPGKGPS